MGCSPQTLSVVFLAFGILTVLSLSWFPVLAYYHALMRIFFKAYPSRWLESTFRQPSSSARSRDSIRQFFYLKPLNINICLKMVLFFNTMFPDNAKISKSSWIIQLSLITVILWYKTILQKNNEQNNSPQYSLLHHLYWPGVLASPLPSVMQQQRGQLKENPGICLQPESCYQHFFSSLPQDQFFPSPLHVLNSKFFLAQ